MKRHIDFQSPPFKDFEAKSQLHIKEYQEKLAELSPDCEDYGVLKEHYESLIQLSQESIADLRALERSERIARPPFRWKNVILMLALTGLVSAVFIYFR